MMSPIEFKVKFITPLLIHGSERNAPDYLGLGKALKGAWHFWFRAIVGGMVPNISKENLVNLEGKVFGSSDENTGAKFRMVIEKINAVDARIPGGFKKKDRNGNPTNEDQLFAGFKENSEFLIKILPRKYIELNALLPSVWLWGNLGGIGQRARRGFGSPVIEISNNQNSSIMEIDGKRWWKLDGGNLPLENSFGTIQDIENHLRLGLPQIYSIFNQWLTTQGQKATGDIRSNSAPRRASCFILKSIKQIAVGQTPFIDITTAISAIHGHNDCKGLGFARGNNRMASPVIMRLYLMNEQYVPVATYTNHGLPNCNNHDCVNNYLLTDAKMKKWLDGSLI